MGSRVVVGPMSRVLGSWLSRATLLTGVVLVVGLLLPVESGDASRGSSAWPDPTVRFHRDGDWSSASQTRINEILDADDEWRDDTDFQPWIVTSAQDNDIMWGERPAGWSAGRCLVPTGGAFALECTKVLSGDKTVMTESDIIVNVGKSWTRNALTGIMVHELGHSGGLAHDLHGSVRCGSTDIGRWTMCPRFTMSNAEWAATLEQHDIRDMDRKY